VVKPASIDELKRVALKAISEKAGIKQPVLRHSAEDVVPSTGKSVYFFSATDKSKPNDPSVSVVLDESGAVVDLANLVRAEGRSFFRPLFPGISPRCSSRAG
jgi:hypothetical protein